jgi:oligo-alginate lyase
MQQPSLIEAKRQMIRHKQGLSERFAPLIPLWWPSGQAQSAPLFFSGQGPQPVAIWRSSWTDPNALYFAIKAGGANYNHAHMDAGSFVLDLDGVRWAKDLGLQPYHTLESRNIDLWNMKQNSPRWRVFRLSSDSHNTLTIDGELHNATGMATLKAADANGAQIDLSPVLSVAATRRVQLTHNTVQLHDELSGAQPGSRIRWAMNTEASISIEANTATLSSGSKTLRIRFSGIPVALEVRDISQPRAEYDAENKNTRQLIAHAPADTHGNWRLEVNFARN